MYDTILVPTDGSQAAHRAVDEAYRLARETGATVHLLFVLDESARSLLLSTESMGSRFDRLRKEAEQFLADLAAEAEYVSVKTALTRGTQVYRGIVDYAEREGVDLIVMGSTGRSGPGGFLGSTTQRVTVNTSLPVLVVTSGNIEPVPVTGASDGPETDDRRPDDA
jgi:nucleotide-binding universal stress UspA family protein